MENEHKLSTCGLSCDICDANTTKIQDSAEYLMDIFKDPMFSGVIAMTNPDFKVENVPMFQEMLKMITQFPPCPGCEGRDECAINLCVKEKSIENCSQCNFLDIEAGSCTAPPEPQKMPFLPPAPVFFNGITQRYKKWNIKNLKAIANGKLAEIDSNIEDMIKKDKSNRDLIDFSVNLFDMKP